MKELINKYVWIVDTLSRYGKLSREEINDLWTRSTHSDGNPIPERTFYYYRRGIEENFHIEIRCDRQGKYFIDSDMPERDNNVTNWLLESYAANSALKDSSIPAGRVAVEDVPSAREYLPVVMRAIGESAKIKFTYAGFSRSRPEAGIIFSPYFVKRYKQRWYMIGMKDKSGGIRTYALDRVKEMTTINEHFKMPDITAEPFFRDLIGITASKGEVKTVRIMTTPIQAKYFRALPFHASQQETIHDNYSIFTYKLKLNFELVHELLSYGNSLKVLEPKELILMVTNQLRDSLSLYDNPDKIPTGM
ncbi:MAG: WYL domain-containing protein [Candidatus Amulumruptor caecigallinarius]|nr:WYL domain-containing protein [Candidatus Amulumruptor caecigallinarius]